MRKYGWLCFRLMWLPFATLFIGMIGLPSGDYAWGELPILTRASLLAVGALAITSTILLVGATIVSGVENHEILEDGQPASAKILRISDTGTTINNNPVVRLLLEVTPASQPAFQAETERLIPRLQIPQIQPGMSVQVKFDPASHEVALLDEDDPNLIQAH
jgi:hypothetical protein